MIEVAGASLAYALISLNTVLSIPMYFFIMLGKVGEGSSNAWEG